MSDLKIINISSDSSESEDQEFSLPQELAYNEERLEKTLALINTIYHITDIRHSLFPIEYPDSSNDGIAYVFHVENWADKKAVFGDIQYSLGKPSGAHSNTFCLYLGVKCKDEKKNMSRVKALQEYLAAIKTKCCYNNYTCNGKLVVRYHKANRSDANQYFIGCSLYTFSTRHRYISGKPNIDEDLLKELFRNEERISTIEDNKKCFTIILSASRKKECPIPHVKDGKIELLPLVKIGCNVIFHKYEPLDLKSCPYIVMVVKNTHSHPPPPSHRIPGHLQENVKNLIKNSNDLLSDTTPRKLISGPLIKAVFGEIITSTIFKELYLQIVEMLLFYDGLGLGLRNDLDGLNFEKERPPRFGFHKGDALPRPGFRLGLLKRRPPGFGFHKGDAFLDLDFGLGDALPGSGFWLGLLK
ncbi:unnamed protein product [Rhizophagus irregularis]|nr:unnamed protein product [Rhizophagus irregularis]